MPVSDRVKSMAFYRDAFGFEAIPPRTACRNR
ncbi:hypothetical protein [Prescottella equi]